MSRSYRKLLIIGAVIVVIGVLAWGLFWHGPSDISTARSGTGTNRLQAIDRLQQADSAEAVRTLGELTQHADAKIAVRATLALASDPLRQQRYQRVCAALNDARPEVKEAALSVMPRFADQVSPSELAEVRGLLRQAPDPVVRAAAARTLGKFRDLRSVVELAKAANDPDVGVRRRVWRALAEAYGRTPCCKPSDPVNVRRAAVKAFVTSQDFFTNAQARREFIEFFERKERETQEPRDR